MKAAASSPCWGGSPDDGPEVSPGPQAPPAQGSIGAVCSLSKARHLFHAHRRHFDSIPPPLFHAWCSVPLSLTWRLSQVRLSSEECADVLKRWVDHLCSPHVNQKSKALLVLLSLGCFSGVAETLHRCARGAQLVGAAVVSLAALAEAPPRCRRPVPGPRRRAHPGFT